MTVRADPEWAQVTITFMKMTAAIGKEIEKGMKAVTRGVDSQAPGRDCTERVFVVSRFFCGLQIGDGHSNGCR